MAIVLLVLAAIGVVFLGIWIQRSARRTQVSSLDQDSPDTSYLFVDSPDTSCHVHSHASPDCSHVYSSGHCFDGGHAGGFDGGGCHH